MPNPEPEFPLRRGRHWLLKSIGEGGMASVYLARVPAPRRGYDRLVAYKRMHTSELGPDATRMFLDEVRIASRLTHPFVCGVLDFGEDSQGAWYTMPLVIGASLFDVSQRLQRASPQVVQAAPLVLARAFVDACEGLHAAHELRDDDGQSLAVVHRDISPQNLLLGYDGILRVADFGIATALSRLHQTATGQFRGKLSYAAPEHLEGQTLDRRGDVWSLGVVLWELVTGKRLFAADSPSDAARMVRSAPIPGIRELCPHVSLGLDEVLSKALSRNRDRRYESARALGEALLGCLQEEGSPLGSAAVAKWFDELCPGEAEQTRIALAEARCRPLPALLPEKQVDAKSATTDIRARSSMPWWLLAVVAPSTLALGAWLHAWLD